MTTGEISGGFSRGVSGGLSWLQRLFAVRHLRYWIIASWAVALATTVPIALVLVWFVITMASGYARTVVERQPTGPDPIRQARLRTLVATLSCVAWAGAPVLSFLQAQTYGMAVAVALLVAGYMLVFTQMRAAPKEAAIVSIPYSLVVVFLIASLWGDPGFWTILSITPVVGLALLIKVVVTRMKDAELEAVNARQVALIQEAEIARDQAKAASDAKSNFLGVVSHELRTPMNGVLGAAQLLELSTLQPQQQEFVSVIRRSGESLLVLLNDILDLTKIEAGRMELAVVDTTFDDLCERMVGPFGAQAEAKGLDFHVEVTGDTPAGFRCDPLRIAQIVQNLLGNAIKFTTEGEVVLSVASTPLSDDRARLTLGVRDTGSGITEADLARLFQPFTQVDASSTRRFGGTGLGLSICRRLGELMGGEIEVQSTPGVGSTFTLSVDVEVTDWRTETEEAAAPAPECEAQSLSVLIVEDHPVNRMVLEAWLTTQAHACTTAENGQLGLDQACMAAFDLIIMDVNMPVMDGLTATAEIRRRAGPNRDTPIVVLSASARAEDHASGYAAGADAYVDKPVDFAALARVVAAAPMGREAMRDLPSLAGVA